MWLSTRKYLFSFGNFYHHFQHFSLPDGHANLRPKTQLYPLLSATNLSTNPRGTCVLTAEMSGLLILTRSLFYPSPSALSHKLRNTNRDLRFHLKNIFRKLVCIPEVTVCPFEEVVKILIRQDDRFPASIPHGLIENLRVQSKIQI